MKKDGPFCSPLASHRAVSVFNRAPPPKKNAHYHETIRVKWTRPVGCFSSERLRNDVFVVQFSDGGGSSGEAPQERSHLVLGGHLIGIGVSLETNQHNKFRSICKGANCHLYGCLCASKGPGDRSKICSQNTAAQGGALVCSVCSFCHRHLCASASLSNNGPSIGPRCLEPWFLRYCNEAKGK
jgi:hypothetical protein